MSVASGLQYSIIPITPVGQITANWTGNNTKITTLNKGRYLIIYTYAFGQTAGLLTSTSGFVTSTQPFGTLGSITLVSNSQTGTMAGGTIAQTMSNVVNINVDNTSIYVAIQNTINAGTTWGIHTNTTKFGKYQNYLGIIHL